MREHVLLRGPIQTHWDSSLTPILAIQSRDTVTLALPDVSGGCITRHSQNEDLLQLDDAYALQGPVFVEGALPGDALEIDMLRLVPDAWGWTGIIPGFGLLPAEFSGPHLYIWDLPPGRCYTVS